MFGLEKNSPGGASVRVIPDNNDTKKFTISHAGAKLWVDKFTTCSITAFLPRQAPFVMMNLKTRISMSNSGGKILSDSTWGDDALKASLYEFMDIYFAMVF